MLISSPPCYAVSHSTLAVTADLAANPATQAYPLTRPTSTHAISLKSLRKSRCHVVGIQIAREHVLLTYRE